MVGLSRRRLLVLGLRGRRLAGRYALTAVSFSVLGLLAALALLDQPFDTSPKDAGALPVAADEAVAPAVQQDVPRETSVIFLVSDTSHARALSDTIATLVWDTHAQDNMADARRPNVQFVVAGTSPGELAAYRELRIAALQHPLVQVVDLR